MQDAQERREEDKKKVIKGKHKEQRKERSAVCLSIYLFSKIPLSVPFSQSIYLGYQIKVSARPASYLVISSIIYGY